MKVGIAITTYNRSPMLAVQLQYIKERTVNKHFIVVSDDGSSDNSVSVARVAGADAVVEGPNRGIAWNKNRGLYYLQNFSDCDVFILLDDDVVPLIHGWDAEWVAATAKLGHINYFRDPAKLMSGTATAAFPSLSDEVAGSCIGFSREVISRIGYFDVRFGKYGHEHSDMSFRALRAGFGGVQFNLPTGPRSFFNVITGGISETAGPSHMDMESLKRNEELLFRSGGEDLYRNAWRSDVQRMEFLSEVVSAFPGRHVETRLSKVEFDEALYLAANPDVAAAGLNPIKHYLSFGEAENRRLRP